MDKAVLRQIACCSVNDRGMFNLYIKFDYAPDPYLAMKQISRACHVAQRPKHMYLKYSINVTFRFSQCDKPL